MIAVSRRVTDGARHHPLRCAACSHRSRHQWLALAQETLSVGAVYDWAVRPDCGAVVLFSGTVRDHAEGRDGVERLEYEAYDDVVTGASPRSPPRSARWPAVGRDRPAPPCRPARRRRVGRGRGRVAPHRAEAFEAARFAIDTLKAAVPIWKHETWSDGPTGVPAPPTSPSSTTR